MSAADIERRLRALEERIRGLESAGRPLSSTAWVAPTLQNSWVDYGLGFQAAQYAKIVGNVVMLRGLIKNGTTTYNTVIFALPVDYRPAADLIFATASFGAYGEVRVLADGNVVVGVAASSTWLSLDGVAFRAD